LNHFENAIKELQTVSISDYEDRVEDICRDLEFETLEEDSWPDFFFPELLKLLSDEKFLSVRTSWHLLKFIEGNWEYLSAAEVSTLKKVLVEAFDKFGGEFMGPFLVAEMLGEFYPDSHTLETLITLNRTSKPLARELVPLGFENLARSTSNQALRESAIAELKTLLQDASEPVRHEAALSLGRIERAK